MNNVSVLCRIFDRRSSYSLLRYDLDKLRVRICACDAPSNPADAQSTSVQAHQFTACTRRTPTSDLETIAKAIECPNEGCRLVDDYQRDGLETCWRRTSRAQMRGWQALSYHHVSTHTILHMYTYVWIKHQSAWFLLLHQLVQLDEMAKFCDNIEVTGYSVHPSRTFNIL